MMSMLCKQHPNTWSVSMPAIYCSVCKESPYQCLWVFRYCKNTVWPEPHHLKKPSISELSIQLFCLNRIWRKQKTGSRESARHKMKN